MVQRGQGLRDVHQQLLDFVAEVLQFCLSGVGDVCWHALVDSHLRYAELHGPGEPEDALQVILNL